MLLHVTEAGSVFTSIAFGSGLDLDPKIDDYVHLRQGSATPGTRATGGTREDFLWHAK